MRWLRGLVLVFVLGCGARTDLAVDDAGPCEVLAETCNGRDDDCDRRVDEELGTEVCGVGACRLEQSICRGGAIRACEPGPPSSETCNGVDDDCDTMIDDVDRGRDGIPDCIRIGLLGNAGAYAASDFVGWLHANGSSVERVLTDGESLTRLLLDRFDVVIIDWLTREYSSAEAGIVFEWVSGGGGLMTMTGYDNSPADLTRPNSFLTAFGLRYVAPLIHGGAVTDFSPHPTTDGLASVTFLGGYRVALEGTSGVVTARIAGEPVAVAHERGLGRVYAWGDEWVEFDSEWRAMPMIQLFWADVLSWLAHLR